MTLKNHNDSGAALLFVLIIITVGALVTGVLLSFTDTSTRTTVALRGQATAAYDGDGSTQAAINALRKSTWNNASGQCFGSAASNNVLTLDSFYPASTGVPAASAAVLCTPEAGTGAQGTAVPVTSANRPGNAVLTLGTSSSEVGQTYGQSNKQITIRGNVVSDSTIDSTKAMLNITGGTGVGVSAVGACTPSANFTPACTHTAGISDPGVADPAKYGLPTTAVAAPASLPACNNQNKVAEFLPGLYTSADTFNNCKASWIHFDPGTYYLDFTTGSHVWSVTKPTVGGTLTAAQSDTAPTVPGACVNPINSTSAVGVELVFGGDSQLSFPGGANAEFCASYHSNSIPTVVYGAKANIPTTGAPQLHAQSGCVIAVGGSGCELISDPGNGAKPNFYFEGFIYAPLASINMAVNNTSQPYFNYGMVLRRVTVTTTASATTAPFISLPDNSPGFGTADTIVDISAYVCPGVTSGCTTSNGKLQLRARVDIHDPTGSPVAGSRQITVLSWSVLR
jgi:hypothetical protein